MNSAQRILQFIEKEHLSKRSFYAAIGASNGFLDKTSNVGSDKLANIIYNYPQLNINWVITGEGEMLNTDKKDDDTPIAIHGFGSDKASLITITPTAKSGNKTTKAQKLDPASDPPTTVLVPQFITVDNKGKENIVHISIKAAAGYLQGFGDAEYMEHLPTFNLPGLTDGTFRSFEVEGDSMYPTLKNGQMVIGRWVERLEDIREDRVYIVIHKTRGVIIKRLLNRIDKYGYVIAKSDATNDRGLYRNIDIRPEEIKELWYAVFNGGFDFQSPSDMWKRLNNTEADLTEILRVLKEKNILDK